VIDKIDDDDTITAILLEYVSEWSMRGANLGMTPACCGPVLKVTSRDASFTYQFLISAHQLLYYDKSPHMCIYAPQALNLEG